MNNSPTQQLSPGLYIIATPIGNLGDITARALETLRAVDLILCEDTRVTGRLLDHYRIDKPLRAYHEHNAAARRPEILKRLETEAIALVSDAGTPLISDPGYKLVQEARDLGRHVTALPGPSAVTTALCLSGLPSDRFLFAGFAPSKPGARKTFYGELADIPATLIVYETAARVAASLGDAADILGDRPAALCRELTKYYEEVIRGGLSELAARLESQPVKGEIALVIGPPSADAAGYDDAAVDALLRAALKTARVKDAAAIVAARTGRPRKDLYARLLELKAAGE